MNALLTLSVIGGAVGAIGTVFTAIIAFWIRPKAVDIRIATDM